MFGGHAKHYTSLKTMLMLNDHLCTSLIIGFVMSLTHPLVELILIFFHYMTSTVCFKSMPHIIICSFAHICVSSKIEGVRIPCCAYCIQMQKLNLCTYLGELPNFIYATSLSSSLFYISWCFVWCKWYRENKDVMFVHIVFKCKL